MTLVEEFEKELSKIQKDYFYYRWQNLKKFVDILLDSHDGSRHSKRLELLISECEKVAVNIAKDKMKNGDLRVKGIIQEFISLWK